MGDIWENQFLFWSVVIASFLGVSGRVHPGTEYQRVQAQGDLVGMGGRTCLRVRVCVGHGDVEVRQACDGLVPAGGDGGHEGEKTPALGIESAAGLLYDGEELYEEQVGGEKDGSRAG